MRKTVPFLLLVLLLAACTGKQGSNGCPTGSSCPAIFIGPLHITYVDKADSPIVVKGFHVIDLRTNQAITINDNVQLNPGTYGVADYSDKKLFSAKGDNLEVTATDTVTNETKTVYIEVGGGTCACDISKISGPDTVKFK